MSHHTYPHPQNPNQIKGTKREKKMANILDPWYKQPKFLGWMNILASILVIQLIVTLLCFYIGDSNLMDSFVKAMEWCSVGVLTFGGFMLVMKFFLKALDKFDVL